MPDKSASNNVTENAHERQRKRYSVVMLAWAVLCLGPLSATLRADIVNGSFETGDFTGWELNGFGGDFFVWADSGVGPSPLDGNNYAEVVNYGEDQNTLTLRQPIRVGVGDVLSFGYATSGFGQFSVQLGTQLLVAANSAPYWTNVEKTIETAGQFYLTFTDQKVGPPDFNLHGFSLDRVVLESMSSVDEPLLPTTVEPGEGGAPPIFLFGEVSSGQWFDPPMAEGYTYQMTAGSLFTGILDFPTGFDTPFTVVVDGNSLGQYEPGDSVDFTNFPGGGVQSFQITGLDPTVDPEDPNAFPLRLLFDTDTADFSMQAIVEVPEPSSLALLIIGIAALACWRGRKGQAPLT